MEPCGGPCLHVAGLRTALLLVCGTCTPPGCLPKGLSLCFLCALVRQVATGEPFTGAVQANALSLSDRDLR